MVYNLHILCVDKQGAGSLQKKIYFVKIFEPLPTIVQAIIGAPGSQSNAWYDSQTVTYASLVDA